MGTTVSEFRKCKSFVTDQFRGLWTIPITEKSRNEKYFGQQKQTKHCPNNPFYMLTSHFQVNPDKRHLVFTWRSHYIVLALFLILYHWSVGIAINSLVTVLFVLYQWSVSVAINPLVTVLFLVLYQWSVSIAINSLVTTTCTKEVYSSCLFTHILVNKIFLLRSRLSEIFIVNTHRNGEQWVNYRRYQHVVIDNSMKYDR